MADIERHEGNERDVDRRLANVERLLEEIAESAGALGDGITVIIEMLQALPPAPSSSSGATQIILTLGGASMSAAEVNVDTQGETIEAKYADDHGNATPGGPAGAVLEFTTDNEQIATVAVDASDPNKGDIAIVGLAGTVNLGVTSNGTALEADGTTPIPDPEPIALQVDPGAPAGMRLTFAAAPDPAADPAEPPASS